MKERRKAGLGAMIRNEMGILCGEVNAPASASSALIAEAEAAICGLQLSSQLYT